MIELKFLTPMQELMRKVNVQVEEQKVRMAQALCDVGRDCVKIAKELPQGGFRQPYPTPYQYLGDTRPNYTDWTSELRNSISWAVIIDGKMYDKFYGSVANSVVYINELLVDYPIGITLLVVATGKNPKNGESYAYYVQALGYDVLKTSQLRGYDIAKSTLNKLFNALN